jgi:thioredoxin 1
MTEAKDVLNLTDSDFNENIASGVTLVDFWAPWCMPCRMQGPIIQDVAKIIGAKAKIAKINVDENQQAAGQFGVFSIPTLIIFKDGQPAKQFVGVQQAETLMSSIESLL